MRKLISVLIAGALVGGMAMQASAAKATVVFTDPAGDTGNSTTGPVAGLDQGGFDLTKGSISRKGKNLLFTVQHAAMPQTGSLPEGFRFLWHFAVGTKQFRFTAKSADIGKPDVLAQNGTERVGQVDTDGHFRLETCENGDTVGVLTLLNCGTVEYLDGTFDPAKKSFTIILPLKAVKAKPGSKIVPGTGGAADTECQICWVPQYAERSLTPITVIDNTLMTKTYKVPR
jgi:hypothetical protein